MGGEINMSNHATTEQTSTQEQEVKQFLGEFGAALKSIDIEKLDKLWAPEFTTVNPAGIVLPKARRMEFLKAPGTKFDYFNIDEVSIRIYDNTAIVTSRTALKAVFLGNPTEETYRATAVLVKRNGQWQMVYQHFTIIPKQ